MKTKLYNDNFLTLTNYKEPMREVEGGFGYYGALLGTLDGDKVMCHVCGKMFGELSAHIRKHDMDVVEYKEKYQLAKRTSLISEKIRSERKVRTLKWLNSLSVEERREHKRKAREGLLAWNIKRAEYRKNFKHSKLTLESKNKRGTCPDQLLEKIKQAANSIGRTPSRDEFNEYFGSKRYEHLIYKTFGSWTKAVKMAGLPRKIWKRGFNPAPHGYSREMLLEFLRIFYEENGVAPTTTDCNRGLVPNRSCYRRVFGSMQKAREEARLPDPIGRYVTKE